LTINSVVHHTGSTACQPIEAFAVVLASSSLEVVDWSLDGTSILTIDWNCLLLAKLQWRKVLRSVKLSCQVSPHDLVARGGDRVRLGKDIGRDPSLHTSYSTIETHSKNRSRVAYLVVAIACRVIRETESVVIFDC